MPNVLCKPCQAFMFVVPPDSLLVVGHKDDQAQVVLGRTFMCPKCQTQVAVGLDREPIQVALSALNRLAQVLPIVEAANGDVPVPPKGDQP
jgi:hypothetical protein